MEDSTQQGNIKLVYGDWSTPDQVASSVWSGPYPDLLEGDLVFAYLKRDVAQVVISLIPNKGFRLSIITPGYTHYSPAIISIDYLKTLAEDLKKFKADKTIIENFLNIINNI